jgi:hypothetical protein
VLERFSSVSLGAASCSRQEPETQVTHVHRRPPPRPPAVRLRTRLPSESTAHQLTCLATDPDLDLDLDAAWREQVAVVLAGVDGYQEQGVRLLETLAALFDRDASLREQATRGRRSWTAPGLGSGHH